MRCIKPNESKKPREFEVKRVLHQVKYLGLLENIRVRRAGYAYRQVYDKFAERFKLLSKKTWPKPFNGSAKDACDAIMKDSGTDAAEWQMGKTKIFLRHPETLFGLEEMKERIFHNASSLIARTYRKWKLRKFFVDLRINSFALLEGKKQRSRMSVLKTFKGDYLEYHANAQLQEIMKPYGAEGNILYCDNFETVCKKMYILMN